MLKSGKKFWIACSILGIILTMLGTIMIDYFPSTAHNVSEGFGGPVFAFEMAKTPEDLVNVFGPAGDPLRAERIAQMDKGNLWDFPFMLVYALFMAAFLWAARLETGKKIWGVFAVIALLSGVFDAVENVILLGLTQDLETAPNIGLLAYPVWSKFLAIWASITAAGVYLIKQSNPIWRILGLITIIGAASILAAFLNPSQFGSLIRNGVTVPWVLMLVFAFASVIKSDRAIKAQ